MYQVKNDLFQKFRSNVSLWHRVLYFSCLLLTGNLTAQIATPVKQCEVANRAPLYRVLGANNGFFNTSKYAVYTDLKFAEFDDGTAHITGHIIRDNDDSNNLWEVDLRLTNRSTWEEWVAQGKTYAPSSYNSSLATTYHKTWTYYDIVPSSQLIGKGIHQGKTLNLLQIPANKGFQLGTGASGYSDQFGFSLWFDYNGSYSGRADINARLINCCEGDGIPLANVSVQDPTCGQSDGKITFSFSDNPTRSNIEFSLDGGGTYVNVSDNQGTFMFSNLGAGNYDLFARWGNDECPVDLGVINLNDDTLAPEISNVSVQDPTCGQSDGKITFSFSDNPTRSNIEFSLDGGGTYVNVSDNQGTFMFSNLGAGNYDLFVRWGNDECPVDLGVINLNDDTLAPEISNVSVQDPTCGQSDGKNNF